MLSLMGCTTAAQKNALLTQEALASATMMLPPANARATTLAREVPAPVLSAGPDSAVEITPTAQSAAAAAPAALPSATPTRTRLPLQSSDLLYLAASPAGRSALMRWDHFTGYSSLLADNVELFSVSADGKKILLLRPHNVSGNGQALYDVDALDYETMQTAALLEQISYPHWLAISPDGAWFAYQERATGGVIHARRTDTPKHHVELGECDSGEAGAEASGLLCAQLAWSPDSRQVMWSDAQGLWISDPLHPTAQPVHKPTVEVTDPKGIITEMPVALHNITWSPVGRFIAVQVTPSLQGVRWQAVVDTRLGHLENIPQSSEYTASPVSVHWTQSGSLVVAHGGEGGAPFVKIWDVLATNSDLMVLKRKYELNTAGLTNVMPTATASSAAPTQAQEAACLTWFAEQDENTIMLGLIFTTPTRLSSAAPLLFSLNLSDGKARRLIELPHDASEVFWAPDGSGALILGEHGQFLFFSLKTNSLSDLQAVISAQAHNFVWLPPAQRR